MTIGLVHVIIVTVTVIFILNFVHCEITACDSDIKQSKSYLILCYIPRLRNDLLCVELNSTNSTYVIFVYFNIKYIGRQVLF